MIDAKPMTFNSGIGNAMTIRSQIEALLQARAASPRKVKEPKYLYHRAGTVVTKNSGGAPHQVVHRSLNPARQSKKWK